MTERTPRWQNRHAQLTLTSFPCRWGSGVGCQGKQSAIGLGCRIPGAASDGV